MCVVTVLPELSLRSPRCPCTALGCAPTEGAALEPIVLHGCTGSRTMRCACFCQHSTVQYNHVHVKNSDSKSVRVKWTPTRNPEERNGGEPQSHCHVLIRCSSGAVMITYLGLVIRPTSTRTWPSIPSPLAAAVAKGDKAFPPLLPFSFLSLLLDLRILSFLVCACPVLLPRGEFPKEELPREAAYQLVADVLQV